MAAVLLVMALYDAQIKFKSRHNEALLEGSLFSHIESLWSKVQQEMAQGTYKPELDASVAACLAVLPWWNQ